MEVSIKKLSFVFFFTSLVFSTSLFAEVTRPLKKTYTLMAYNIENLFDTTHDEGKNDYTYLPLSVKRSSTEALNYCKLQNIPKYRDDCFNLNWDEKVLAKKIQNISKVIRSFNNAKGPDIIVVEEVENLKVLTKLRDQGLKDLGYKTVVLIEGPDKRGVDVGLLSRFPLVSSQIHVVDMSKEHQKGISPKQTRAILEVTLKIDGKNITVFGNHWPSQRSPDSDRLLAAQTLLNATQKLKNPNVIAAGDFNTVDEDVQNGLRDLILNKSTNPHYIDTGTNNKPTEVSGSYYHRGKWINLDKILTLAKENSLIKNVEFLIFAPSFILKQNPKLKRLEPFRFNPATGEGHADHMPIILTFKF